MNSIDINYQEVPDNEFDNRPEFFTHLKVLLWKQYLTQIRSKKSIICVCLSPFFLCLILFLIQISVSAGLQYDNPNPVITPLAPFPKCTPMMEGDSCVSLGYGILGNQSLGWVDYTMNFIANQTGFIMGQDIQLLYTGNNYTDFNNYFVTTPGVIQIAILFCTATELPIPSNISLADDQAEAIQFLSSTFPANCQYVTDFENNNQYNVNPYLIVYNRSSISTDYTANPTLPLPDYPTALALKSMVNNAIIDYYNNQTGQARINVSTQNYPQTQLKMFEGIDIVDSQGSIYFFIAPMIAFIVILNDITNEKEKRLRQGLSVVGVAHFTYWVHWFVVAIVYAGMVTFVLLASGCAFQFKVFLNAPILIHIMVFFFFTLAMQVVAFFLYTLVPTVKMANIVGYAMLLFGIVIQLFLSNSIVLKYLYDETNAGFVQFIVGIFLLYPAFSFSAIYTDIVGSAGDNYNSGEARWVPGPGYTWAQFGQDHTGTVSGTDPFDYPSSLYFFGWLILDIIIYCIIIFYTDHVIAHNRGSGSSATFFLKRNYWSCLKKSQSKRRRTIQRPPEEGESEEDSAVDTVLKEKEKVQRHIEQKIPSGGIRIENLSKVYKTKSCGSSKNDVKALSNLYLEVNEGELLGLLGHNGAGKTTLINILTGVLGGFEGKVSLDDYDIEENKEEIKKIVGVCPQFDILWYELTAAEHLKLFAQIKGIPKEDIANQAKVGLQEVNLSKVADVWAGTFSGGMKRRLSMAIASIGNPKIVFLDEPTTGMDPKNRRQVWELIKNLKKNKVVILTTHAMEEADALSDRIAVIVDGKFKCIGTSLFLKNNFGEGYRLTLVVDPDKALMAKNLLQSKIPSAKVVDESGGSIVFSIPAVRIRELQGFFRVLENKDDDEVANQLRALTHDWGLSNTTLEEVFMKVTGKKEKKFD